MSEAEWVDDDYECFTEEAELRAMMLLNEDWENMKAHGYIWRDRDGQLYKPHKLTTRHLKNILKLCQTHYRPVEQITKLQQLLEYRTKSSNKKGKK